jgi:hypothetical protein
VFEVTLKKSSSQIISFYLYFKVIILCFVNTVYDSPIVDYTVDAFYTAPAIYSVTQGHIADDFNDQQRRRYSTDTNLNFFTLCLFYGFALHSVNDIYVITSLRA